MKKIYDIKKQFLELSGTRNALLKKKTLLHNAFNAYNAYTKRRIQRPAKINFQKKNDKTFSYLVYFKHIL